MAEAFGNPDDTVGGGRNVGPKVVGNPPAGSGFGRLYIKGLVVES